MKTRIVLWGKDSSEAKCLIALELLPEESKVNSWVYPETLATEELGNQLLFDWRDGKEDFVMPEGGQSQENDLTISAPLLPEGIEVDKPEILQRTQTEWHFMVLSSKLNAAYNSELDDFAERVGKLETYNHKAWEELKNFWEKVREQTQERNLFREHAAILKDRTNDLFAKLKELRTALDAEFKLKAEENYAKFGDKLTELEERIAKDSNLQGVFEELKGMQRTFKNAKFTRELRAEIWKRLDDAFKLVKEKRFGAAAATSRSNSPDERLARRYDGLMSAIQKMTVSINRDEEELDFQNKKINSVHAGQLETQIRQHKTKMIEERISSKKIKLEEMMATKIELDDRLEKAKEQAAKRAEAEAAKKAKAEAARKAKAEAAQKAEAEAAVETETTVEAPAVEVKTATEAETAEEEAAKTEEE